MNVGEQSMNGGKSVNYNQGFSLFETRNPNSVVVVISKFFMCFIDPKILIILFISIIRSVLIILHSCSKNTIAR